MTSIEYDMWSKVIAGLRCNNDSLGATQLRCLTVNDVGLHVSDQYPINNCRSDELSNARPLVAKQLSTVKLVENKKYIYVK